MQIQEPIVINVDIKKPSLINHPQVTQNDSNTLLVNVFDAGKPLNLEGVTEVSIAHTRHDTKTIVAKGSYVGANQVEFLIDRPETSVTGQVDAVVQIYNADSRISTLSFSYRVIADPTNNYTPSSATEKTLIEVVLNDGPLRIQEAIEATENANSAADNAVEIATQAADSALEIANGAADNANQVADEIKTRWLQAVETTALRDNAYPTPVNGDTVRVTSEAKTYRYDSTNRWVVTDIYNAAAIDQVTAQLADISQNTDLTLSVGNGGDTNSINTAIDFLSKKIVKYKQNGIKAEIKLLSGFVMSEQVVVDGLDLGWISITSEDAVVTINRSALTQNTVGLPSYDGVTLAVTSYAAFTGKNNAVLPQISCLFSMDTTGTGTSRDGICLVNGAQAVIHKDCGFTNAGGKGAYVVQGSALIANGSKLTNAGGGGISCFRNSRVAFRGGDVSGATGHGLYLDSASSMDAQGVIINGAGDNGIYLDGGSVIACPNATITNVTTNGIYCINGSTADAHNAVINGTGARGVSCASAIVSVKGSTISNIGTDAIYSSGGTVSVDDAKLNTITRYAIQGVYGASISASRVEINNILEIAVNVDTASVVALTNGKIDNASKAAIVSANASKVAANNIIINSAGSRGIQCEGGSNISVRNAQILNSKSDGIYCAYGATVNADGATVTGSTGKGVYAIYGGLINARNVNARKVVDIDNNDDIRVEYGGTITAHGATGGNAGVTNTVSATGIIYR